jgi:hypothetical protein
VTIFTQEKVVLTAKTPVTAIAASIVYVFSRVRGDVKNVRILSHEEPYAQTMKCSVIFIYKYNRIDWVIMDRKQIAGTMNFFLMLLDYVH